MKLIKKGVLGLLVLITFSTVTGITPVGQSLIGAETAEAATWGGVYYSPAYTRKIQRSLNNFKRRYPVGYGITYKFLNEDGSYGNLTAVAVKQFQYAYRGQLKQDGHCGANTWRILSQFYY